MSDVKLRELERRTRTTSALTGQVRYFAEALRLGRLEASALRLAAYCGHRPSQAVLGPTAAPPDDPHDWLRGLARWEARLSARTAAAAVRSALPLYEAETGGDDRARRAVEAAEAWADCPCEDHARAAERAGAAAFKASTERGPRPLVARAASLLTREASTARTRRSAPSRYFPWLTAMRYAARSVERPDALRSAVAEALRRRALTELERAPARAS